MNQPSPESKTYAMLLVIVQFVTGVQVIYFGSQAPLQPVPILLILAGLAVALTGILTMRLGNFRVLPIPKTDVVLVTGGIYGLIRHPMYTGVLLTTLGFAINDAAPPTLVAWGILLIDLLLKLTYEERLLANRFPAYAEYKARTSRLIPFVW